MSLSKKEMKHQKFREILKRRMNNLSNQFRLLSNLSNKSNYSYENNEIQEMFDEIEHLIELLKHDFNFYKDYY